MIHICPYCLGEFTPSRMNQRYCKKTHSQRAWRERHAEKHNAQARASYHKNREKRLVYMRAWWAKNGHWYTKTRRRYRKEWWEKTGRKQRQEKDQLKRAAA